MIEGLFVLLLMAVGVIWALLREIRSLNDELEVAQKNDNRDPKTGRFKKAGE